MVIPEKPPGAWYVVSLRRDYPAERGRKYSYPVPALGAACVCCDEANAPKAMFDPSANRSTAEPIAIPVCIQCRRHVSGDNHSQEFMGVLSGLCLVGGLWCLTEGFGWAAGVAAGLGVLCYWSVAVTRRKRRELAEMGHYSGLQISAHPGLCTVRTMNRRLAQDLATIHGNDLY